MKNVIDEGLNSPIWLKEETRLTKAECHEAIDYVLKKIDEKLEEFTNKFPAPASVNYQYPAIDNTDWTSSFWTGMLWLAYEVTGDHKYREVAEIQLNHYKKRINERINVDTHDLGFLYTLSCVAAYKLTDNGEAKNIAITAADTLMERYFDKAGIIQAWGNLEDPKQQGRMIIDCCMNLPLLFWATEVTGDQRYYEAANAHLINAAKYLIREDASSYHTYYMDTDTGKPKYGKTHQGHSDDSCWSRGQTWGIYGFALGYLFTGNKDLITINKKITHYYLNRLPKDYVNYWDLIFVSGIEERDSSASAIAACGLLETAKHLETLDRDKETYNNAARRIMYSLMTNYTTEGMASNGVLKHAVYGKPQGNGIDECNIWGDYYYFEALVRLAKDWELYW